MYRPISEAEAEAETEAEAEVIPGPEPISEIEESIYENPYSTRIYHNFGGSIVVRNFDRPTDETIIPKIKKIKWHLLCLVIGLLTGVILTGLSMRFTIIEDLVISQRELKDCKAQLKVVIEEKQDLQKKFDLISPWSEWSSCSKKCWGTKIRTRNEQKKDAQ